jgi:hypothetical protein
MEAPSSEYLVLLKNRVTFSYSFIFLFIIPTVNLLSITEDPVFSTLGQSAQLEKKLLPHKTFIGSISFGKSFFRVSHFVPKYYKTGSSVIYSRLPQIVTMTSSDLI